jgi:hypothetical protein
MSANDFGIAGVKSRGKNGGSRVVYKSQYLDNYEFKFAKIDNADNLFECEACYNVKKDKSLDCSIPFIKVEKSRIVEFDPDSPKFPHFCLQPDQAKTLKKRMRLGQRRTTDTVDVSYNSIKHVSVITFNKNYCLLQH